jgi:glycosyltransferase involved in cell wall biosynthesis
MTAMDRPLRVLVVSYAFPPVGGAGVQRVLKLVKYLPEYGIRPSVLTVDNPSVPLFDASLARDVPPEVAVFRAPTLEPGYGLKAAAWNATAAALPGIVARARRRLVQLAKLLLFPDPQVLWQPGAQRALLQRLVGREPDDVVFVSGPPFSQFLLGPLARLRRGTAVVFDYRDEWTTLNGSYEMSGRGTAKAAALLEGRLLRSAHAVITATDAFRNELLRRFRFLDPERVHAIPNGYDPEDFPHLPPAQPADRFVLTYAGTVFRLTSARGLLEGLRLLHQREPELARLLEVRFIGRVVDTEQDYFAGSERLGVRQLGYVEHARVIEELGRSHATLCILDEVPGTERIYPAKIFELMRLGRPCLALAPEGALAELVRRHRLGAVVPPRDAERIRAELSRMLREFAAGGVPVANPIDVERYDRKRQAGQFAEIFRRAVAEARNDENARAAPQRAFPAASVADRVRRFARNSTFGAPGDSARRYSTSSMKESMMNKPMRDSGSAPGARGETDAGS